MVIYGDEWWFSNKKPRVIHSLGIKTMRFDQNQIAIQAAGRDVEAKIWCDCKLLVELLKQKGVTDKLNVRDRSNK